VHVAFVDWHSGVLERCCDAAKGTLEIGRKKTTAGRKKKATIRARGRGSIKSYLSFRWQEGVTLCGHIRRGKWAGRSERNKREP